VNWNFVFRDEFDTKERLVDVKTICPQGKWLAKGTVQYRFEGKTLMKSLDFAGSS
jgi:hypothetical protein